MNIDLLKNQAKENRKTIIKLVYYGKAGHPGGALSIIDILTYLYETEIDLSSNERTKIVLSKGHAVAAQYACLYSKGVISEDEIKTFRVVDSRLQGHPHTGSLPEVDATTGLLGQGLSIGLGMSLAKRIKKTDDWVFVIVGDGELHEGQIWEALMQAPSFNITKLMLILDNNKLSSSNLVKDIVNVEPIEDKLQAFGWDVHTIDGHDFKEIEMITKLKKRKLNAPIAIIANTIKGKGISYMENIPAWHSAVINDEQFQIAMHELGERL